MKTLLNGHKILLADDEHFTRMFIVRMLRDLGCSELVEANNGFVALERLKEAGRAPSIILLDFNMPEANGLQVLKAIRSGEAATPRDARIVMLTGNTDFGLVKAAMALEVDAFILKPVSLTVMANRLEKLLAETREVRAAEVYRKVEIDTIGKRLLNSKPVGLAPPRPPNRPSPNSCIRIKLNEVPVGATLAENLCGPGGEVLVTRSTVLSERLLRRLKELQPATKLSQICIVAPTEG